MRDWLVGGAIIDGPEGVLLVRNRRRDGSHDWSTPGGVIEADEDMLSGLTREVEEETGILVREWAGPLYEVLIVAPGLGWRLRVEAHRAVTYEGELRVADPDGIVVDARFVPRPLCATHLAGCARWVREPLTEFLAATEWSTRNYRYDVEGVDRRSIVVTRS